MKTQKYNVGELAVFSVEIEQKLIESIKKMSEKSGININDIVTVALKRFKASHTELENQTPEMD